MAIIQNGGEKKAAVRIRLPFFGRKSTASKGEDRELDGDAAMEELRQTAKDLETLTEIVGKFADWWSNMDMALAGVDIRSDALTAGGKNKLKVKGIKKSWVEIHDDYAVYKREVCVGVLSLRSSSTKVL
jgi:hypothetical protein